MGQRGGRGALSIAQRPAPLRPWIAAIGIFGRCEIAQGAMRPDITWITDEQLLGTGLNQPTVSTAVRCVLRDRSPISCTKTAFGRSFRCVQRARRRREAEFQLE